MEYNVKTREDAVRPCSLLIRRGLEREEQLNLLLSGGRSIIPVLEALRCLQDKELQKIKFYLADERYGSDYNQEALREQLFSELINRGRISEDALCFPDITKPIESAAAEYAKAIVDFDLAFFGVGEDGHIASLFPEHRVLSSVKTVDFLTDSPKPPPARITLTFRALSRRTSIVLLFFGESKQNAFETFKQSDDFTICPAAFLKNSRQLTIIHDQRRKQ